MSFNTLLVCVGELLDCSNFLCRKHALYLNLCLSGTITWKETRLWGSHLYVTISCVTSRTEIWQMARKGGTHSYFSSVLGFSFDLSPLTKKNGHYTVNTEEYLFYINVCGSVPNELCHTQSAACQVTQRWVTNSFACNSFPVVWYVVCVTAICILNYYCTTIIQGICIYNM